VTTRDLLAAALLAALMTTPLWKSGEWRSTDAIAAEQSTTQLETPLAVRLSISPEIESGLFALQAAAGAGVLGFLAGYRRGTARRLD
jgi:cobalt/nickel transport protein